MNNQSQIVVDETSAPTTPNWWVDQGRRSPEAPAGYAEMIDAMRTLQERIATAVPDAALAAEVTRDLEAVSRRLEPSTAADEWGRLSGFAHELPGRGQTLIPPVEYEVDDIEQTDDLRLRARVRYDDYYLGGNSAVHGGAIPLVFDDVLGRLANSGGRSAARTAYLHIDFRSVTPVGRPLTLEARFEREEGRKRYLRGWLRDGDRLCVEVEGLFVQLRPGQP